MKSRRAKRQRRGIAGGFGCRFKEIACACICIPAKRLGCGARNRPEVLGQRPPEVRGERKGREVRRRAASETGLSARGRLAESNPEPIAIADRELAHAIKRVMQVLHDFGLAIDACVCALAC